jgi:hypothetical protein
MENYEQLERIQSEFKEFMRVVRLQIGLTDEDRYELGYVEVAKLIENPAMRETYCQLASKLLEENIRAAQSDDEEEYTSEWAETLLMWCTVREELKRV